jgi:phosphopantetheinyl transferase (holo-ACP synthase)
MIGNDIVDLDDPETGTVHPGFDQRVFTAAERGWIEAAVELKRARWTLWAAKEAAWKALAQRWPGRGFSPKTLEVQPQTDACALVTVSEARLYICFDSSSVPPSLMDAAPAALSPPGSNPIHAIASFEKIRTVSHIRQLAAGSDHAADYPSRAVRALACGQRALELGVDAARLTIERTLGGAPRFRLDDTPLPGALSFSHHGRFVAAVWLQSNPAEVA